MKLVIANNNDNPVASVPIPDASIQHLRKVFGGGTNAQTATNVLQFLLRELRQKARAQAQNEARAAAMIQMTADEHAAGLAFDVEWGE